MSHIPQDAARRLVDKLGAAAPHPPIAQPDVLQAAAEKARAALSDLLLKRDPIVYSDALRALDEALSQAPIAQPQAAGWRSVETHDQTPAAAPSAPAPAEVPMPEPYATLHHDDGYFTTKARDDGRHPRPFRTDVVTLEQCAAYGDAREAAAVERVRVQAASWRDAARRLVDKLGAAAPHSPPPPSPHDSLPRHPDDAGR